MALNLKPEAQIVFFKKVFGDNHAVTNTVQALINAGATVEVDLYTLKIKHTAFGVFQQALTTGTTSMMKGGLDLLIVQQNKLLIQTFISGVYQKVFSDKSSIDKALNTSGGVETVTPGTGWQPKPTYYIKLVPPLAAGLQIPVIKAIRELTKLDLFHAKQMTDQVKNGETVIVTSVHTEGEVVLASTKLKEAGGVVEVWMGETKITPTFSEEVPAAIVSSLDYDEVEQKIAAHVASKPTPKVIGLREAQTLGQKVHGTSMGSVYHCVAVGDRVKIAARILKSGSISIRAEWDGITKDEQKKLADAGLEVHMGSAKQYASMHVSAGEIPPSRIIGAFLMSTGLQWKEVVTWAGQLQVDE
jgi:hypothetical protein